MLLNVIDFSKLNLAEMLLIFDDMLAEFCRNSPNCSVKPENVSVINKGQRRETF